MDRKLLVLAALAPAEGDSHTPVQIQKLLFLIDRQISDEVGGPYFDFQPYDYGPFDQEVYQVLEELISEDLIEVAEEPGRHWKKYSLTHMGQVSGEDAINSLKEPIRDYIQTLSNFVRSLSFPQLVSSIYKAYPEMRENSVFRT